MAPKVFHSIAKLFLPQYSSVIFMNKLEAVIMVCGRFITDRSSSDDSSPGHFITRTVHHWTVRQRMVHHRGRFMTRTFHHQDGSSRGRFIIGRFITADVSLPGRFITRTVHLRAVHHCGRFITRTFHHKDGSSSDCSSPRTFHLSTFHY